MNDMMKLFDAFNTMSDLVHRAEEVKRLRFEIEMLGTKCGDCYKWMKSRECPLERNVMGRSVGPHMNHSICGEFIEDSFTTDLRNKKAAELELLLNQPA